MKRPGISFFETERLVLTALDAEALDAWVAGNAAGLRARTGARFPEPVEAPPLLSEDLPRLRDALRADPDGAGRIWLAALREDRLPVGALGMSPPDADGVSMIGYSVYPVHEGRGYATEALRGLVQWAFGGRGVLRIRATIPPWNAPSVRVAEKAGFARVGTGYDREVGDVLVFELEGLPCRIRRNRPSRVRRAAAAVLPRAGRSGPARPGRGAARGPMERRSRP